MDERPRNGLQTDLKPRPAPARDGGIILRSAYFVLPIALTLALMPVEASHCTTWSTSENDADTLIVYNPALNLYHVWDHCQPDCLFSYWAYYEDNGIPGLQRSDEVVDDTCHGQFEGDTWFY